GRARATGPKGDRKVLVELSSFMWPSPNKGCMAKNAGVAKWLKAQGLGPCHEGVRGFDSRPPHIEIMG
ncbi:MAG: hypothetical protein QG646_1869, partial [Euryarchaeota archaeon]|nr:hypothetical protein [Euryarchaeota archaeon]